MPAVIPRFLAPAKDARRKGIRCIKAQPAEWQFG